MLAAVVERFGEPYTMTQIPRPSAPEGQDILVKVLAASYCHTDTVSRQGGFPTIYRALVATSLLAKLLLLGQVFNPI